MPQDYGRVMGSMADTVAGPLNAFVGSYALGKGLQQRDEELRQRNLERNSLMEQRQQQQSASADAQQLLQRYSEMRGFAQSPETKAQYIEMQKQRHPEFAQTPFASMPPDVAFDGMQAQLATMLGMEAPQQQPAKRDIRNVGGALLEIPATGDPRVLYREPERPQQGPVGSWSVPFKGLGQDGKPGMFTQHSITGQVRPVGVAPMPNDSGGVGGMGSSLNDRQRSGLSMQKDNALAYAANLTKTPLAEVQKIYATSGPAGVGMLMRAKGKRGIQGAAARVLQDLPFGQTIVDANNADLLAPAFGGGAGIALMQNPTGPVANADFAAGRMQFPNATYPLETQAGMVEQLLKSADAPAQSGGPPTFATEAEAAAAGLQPGTRVVIGGVPGTWQ